MSQLRHGLPNPAYVIAGDLQIDVDVTIKQSCQFQRGSWSNLNYNLTSWGPNTRVQCHTLVICHFKLLHTLDMQRHKIYLYVKCLYLPGLG
jgi:hypothetical protein